MSRTPVALFLIILCIAVSISCKEDSENANTSPWASLTEQELLDTLQYQTIMYFWDGAEPISGLARERLHMDNQYSNHDRDVVTIGGSGFGLMAILVGVERGFIEEGLALQRFEKIVHYLARADRFHGVWPHWLYGPTGRVYPFSKNDDGGDLVETSFLIQGLLTVAEYYRDGDQRQKALVEKIDKLWREVEWDWYTQGGQDVLYWHWSPTYQWEKNFAIGGYNECLITYILAAASPTHPVNKQVYDKGWARGGKIGEDTVYYELETELDHYEHNDDPVGPLFWAHYSYLGLCPRDLKDNYADYWKLNRNHALIHYKYCLDNPEDYEGYGDSCWGLTSSYSMNGYAAHHPGTKSDLGVISPTAAISSMPYTPSETIAFVKWLYTEQPKLIGRYGPYDAFSLEYDWYTPRYLAIDQGPIPVMIENHRTGLLWSLFMRNKDVQKGLEKLQFEYPRKQ